MVYTAKEPSDLAGVSRRTLHFFDQIGLIKPSGRDANSSRYYRNEYAGLELVPSILAPALAQIGWPTEVGHCQPCPTPIEATF